MDLLNTFANQYLFPFFVFLILISFFQQPTKIDRTATNLNQPTIVQKSITTLSPLEQFYDRIEQDPQLLDRIEIIITQDNFITEITALGNSLGYQFSILELEKTVTYINNHYICLPIGCWNKDTLWDF